MLYSVWNLFYHLNVEIAFHCVQWCYHGMVKKKLIFLGVLKFIFSLDTVKIDETYDILNILIYRNLKTNSEI